MNEGLLVEKVLDKYLPKDPSIRRCEERETRDLHPDLQRYAALDAFALRMVFEQVTKTSPLDRVQHDSTPGTRVALLVQVGGDVAAYGKISAVQSTSFQGIRVAVPSKTRVIVDIDHVRLPSAAAILHLLPSTTTSTARRTKSGSYILLPSCRRGSRNPLRAVFGNAFCACLLRFARFLSLCSGITPVPRHARWRKVPFWVMCG
ncbi:hypothetical protein B0H13DRAFT_1853400 [Mycena leptocephala]|nr:hypothetical protein B0H13DRAFT_1853400 [Mycena leptocephala]